MNKVFLTLEQLEARVVADAASDYLAALLAANASYGTATQTALSASQSVAQGGLAEPRLGMPARRGEVRLDVSSTTPTRYPAALSRVCNGVASLRSPDSFEGPATPVIPVFHASYADGGFNPHRA